MIQKIKCFLGFHFWSDWQEVYIAISSRLRLKRSCKYCKTIEEHHGLVERNSSGKLQPYQFKH